MQLEPLLQALSDPTRRVVLEKLIEREHSVNDLRQYVSVSQPAISQHLKVLTNASLISQRREGRCTFYRATPEGLAPLINWLKFYSEFWPERIDRLDKLLIRKEKHQ